MALGGGSFVAQNKILPGAYVNFAAAARASAALSERGIATMPVTGDWGPVGSVVEVTAGDFQKSGARLFGYDYTAPQLKPLRELFRNVRTAYLYRMGAGGAKASNAFAVAKYAGTRGNALTVAIVEALDAPGAFEVSTYFDGALADVQTAASAAELAANDFVTWTGETLAETAGTPLAGGTNPTVTNADYQAYLDAIEPYAFNALGCPSDEAAVKDLFIAFTKRMRDEVGVKFQCVAHNRAADYEGVVNVLNGALDGDASAAVYWVTGLVAGTAVNRSATNAVYDGEYAIDVNHTQAQLEEALKEGKFAFHRVGGDARVLGDVNSLTTRTDEKGEDFKSNQTIRVLDQIANDIAALFNTRYLGVVPNDDAGRDGLWADIVQHHRALAQIRAIEGFESANVTVEQGENKRSVVVGDRVTPTNAMEQLYMNVVVA